MLGENSSNYAAIICIQQWIYYKMFMLTILKNETRVSTIIISTKPFTVSGRDFFVPDHLRA